MALCEPKVSMGKVSRQQPVDDGWRCEHSQRKNSKDSNVAASKSDRK